MRQAKVNRRAIFVYKEKVRNVLCNLLEFGPELEINGTYCLTLNHELMSKNSRRPFLT